MNEAVAQVQRPLCSGSDPVVVRDEQDCHPALLP
jgi:hypothetical protein